MLVNMKLKNVLAIGLLFFLFNCGKDDTPPQTFIITFDSQGGTPVDPITVTAPATTIANLPVPTKTGFIFAGWFTNVNGGGTPFTTSSIVNANTTVYAFWQHVPYTVTFDSQGGTAVSSVIIEAPATTIGTLPAPPTKTRATFGGWSTTAEGSTLFTADTPVTDDITVYAIWNWIAGTLPSSANWQSVTYGNGIFVAIANGSNQAATSQDGITWTAQTLPDNVTTLTSVTYGNGIFVAVSEGTHQTVTSPDGVTWTERTVPIPYSWVAVSYGNGIFVATSANNIVATSPDGITWTKQTPPGSFNVWYAITYGNGVFTMLGYATSIAMTSPDGVNWTQRTLPCISATGDSGWNSVAYGNGTFVAISTGGCNFAATSPDGITWTARTLPGNIYWKQVAYGNNTFVAMVANKNQVITSADGINWTYKNLPGSSNWSSIAYGNGIFVIIAKGSNQVATSP